MSNSKLAAFYRALRASLILSFGYSPFLRPEGKTTQFRAHCSHELVVYRSVHCIGPAMYETLAHERFAAARRRGEWFVVTREEIDAFLAELEM